MSDHEHLRPYGYAPGNYMSKCHRCGAKPIMDKRATTCRECAEALYAEVQPAQTDNLLVKREEWAALSPEARQLLNAAARAQPAQAGALQQALTDSENQPNQYGIEFLMHGPKFAFKVGNQQFTLDYEPTEPGEFEFMRDMLISAFSDFTPDVKTAQAVALLTDAEVDAAIPPPTTFGQRQPPWNGSDMQILRGTARAIEQAVRSKLGAGVPMTDPELVAAVKAAGFKTWDSRMWALKRLIEAHHGIVGKEGGK